MRDFVVYHNSDLMGYEAEESDPFSVYTKKKYKDPIGDRVWVLTGKGKTPKQYFVSSWFDIERVLPADQPEFEISLSGTGKRIDPMARVDDKEWFAEFFRKMGHFSFGLTEIGQSEVVEGLKQVAAVAGCPTP